MKALTQLSLVIAVSFISMGGCQTLKDYATPANARIAASLVCTNTLTFAVNSEDQAEVANYIYSVAQAVRTLSGGKVPTRDELQRTINLFTPGAGKWATLSTNIAGIYGGVFIQIKGDPKLALEYLEALAAGCEDAAQPFLKPSPTPTL